MSRFRENGNGGRSGFGGSSGGRQRFVKKIRKNACYNCKGDHRFDDPCPWLFCVFCWSPRNPAGEYHWCERNWVVPLYESQGAYRAVFREGLERGESWDQLHDRFLQAREQYGNDGPVHIPETNSRHFILEDAPVPASSAEVSGVASSTAEQDPVESTVSSMNAGDGGAVTSSDEVQRTTLRGNIPGNTEYDEQVQAFLDSRAASKQQQHTRMPGVKSVSTATTAEQLRLVIKNTNVTSVVAETRPTGIPTVSTSVQTAANEEQVPPVKAPMIVQQPKAAVAAETRPALSKLQPVTMATVGQQTETPSAAAVPSDNFGLALMALPNKDFVFKVKYDQVPIHKTVLGARSYYFYQQFYENSGNSSPTFENADDFDKEVIELVVRACYGQSFDETTLDERIAEQLIKFADIYGMSCVKNLLQQTLANCLTEETVFSAAIRSYDTNDLELRKKCAAFVAALILQNKSTPRGIEELPADFNKEIVLAIIAEKNKKQ